MAGSWLPDDLLKKIREVKNQNSNQQHHLPTSGRMQQ
jgi:hypothetical protein